jgi:hypothetical protein
MICSKSDKGADGFCKIRGFQYKMSCSCVELLCKSVEMSSFVSGKLSSVLCFHTHLRRFLHF